MLNLPYILIDLGVCKRFNSGVWCRAVSVLGIRLAFLNLKFLSGILVRDEAARDKVRTIVGEIGLIMSVRFSLNWLSHTYQR